MPFIKTITQGGQVHIHQLRMLKQILIAGFVVAFIVGGGHFIWKSLLLPANDWRIAYETYWAKFLLTTVPSEKHKNIRQLYIPPQGKPYRRSSLSILQDLVLKKATLRVEKHLELTGYKSLKLAGWTYLSIMGFWFIFGLAQKRTQHQRGNTLVPWKHLRTMLRRKREASDLKLYPAKAWSKLPLVKHKETSHILITGTTGSGKTNAFHHLLPQIRKRGDRAIVLDVTGDYVSRYYKEGKDIILNPLDQRSRPWHPWADCHLDSHYDVLAESLIQSKDSSNDPFWDNASRMVLKTALRKFAYQENKDIEKLTAFLLSASDKEFEDFFKGTEAATFAFKNSEKTTHSIRSVLSYQIECLRQLEPTQNSFSIRNWVMNDPPSLLRIFIGQGPLSLLRSFGVTSRQSAMRSEGLLFITARADQRQTLTPLISAWMDIALNALMILPEDQKRRLWFIIDELAALQKLPRLQAGLAEGRKYGGCLLAGFQSKPQLEEIYGRNAAEAILDLFNTKIFFRCTEPSTQAWISKVLGDKEEIEPTENISYGANSMRDGVSLSHHTRQKPLVLPTELSQLKDLECYLKYPGDYPCTKLQTKYKRAPFFKKKAFLLKPERKRVYNLQLSEFQDVKKEKLE
ncbi:MAG: hypothetical protein BGO67_03055 [Alphaproteobacteria bacterium 41-28]|nr:MAG: hypothetical protein BGO67_03055 [Alphaproteobacteria bacterium 41-28]